MRKLKKTWASLLVVFVMVLSLVTPAYAVTGSQVAADGVYSTSITAYKYKYGKLDKTYYGTFNLAVSDGEIAGMWISNASSDKMSKLITNEIYYTYVGKEASVDAVNSTGGVDAVSSASVAGSTSSVDSSVKKQYVADIKGTILKILQSASTASGSSGSESSSTATTTVTGTATVSDSEGSKLVLNVGLDSSGKIVNLTVDNDASISNWDSIVSKNADSYIGKTASEVDAVSGATKYSTAVNTAVLDALDKASNTTSAAPKIISGNGSKYTKKSGTGLTIASDAEYSAFQGVTVDGSTISSSYYSVESGSTVVTLSDTYLDMLGTGTHTIGIVSNNGTASGTFTVAAASNDSGSGSGSGSSSGQTISAGGSAKIAVGETVTLAGTYNDMASENDITWTASESGIVTIKKGTNSSTVGSLASVTGTAAGTVTVTYEAPTLMWGTTTETFTITVTDGSSSESTTAPEGSSDPSTGITAINVTKEWKNDTASDRPESVSVGIYEGSELVQTLTLNSGNNWTATASNLDASKTYSIKEEVVEGYTTSILQGEDTTGSGGAGWVAQSYGAVEAGKTYAFTYTSNGTTYLLGRSGTSVIGSTSGLSGGVPTASIGNDYKWEISKATSGTSYGQWLAKNLGNNYYLAPYNGYSTGYSNSAVLQSSNSYYSNVNLHFDDDGSVWNGYGGLNLYASGSTVKSDGSNYTVFTPYLYTSAGSSSKTANYTITNTKDNSGSDTGGNTGGETGGGDENEPGDPTHEKSITDDSQVKDDYTISLNVTGQSKTTTSTTQTGTTTTSPYDILLVLDNTRSMQTSYGNTTRLTAMKSAATTFVNGLPAADGSKIAMVSFVIGNGTSPTTTNVSWTGLSAGKSSVTSAISGLTAPDATYSYDTCFTQPLERASTLLDSVSSDGNKKYVVFFTDGAAVETLSTIQSLASTVQGKADATFSIGIVSGATETQKAQALASSSANYYDVTTAGTMGTAFTNALGTIQSETTVTKVPMTGVVIKDTLSDYVELKNAATSPYDITLTSNPADSNVTIDTVTVADKVITVSLSGDLTDDTVYTINIPVVPSNKARKEADEADDEETTFVSNATDGASLTYQYGTEESKTVLYTEMPKIVVEKQAFKVTYKVTGDKPEEITLPEDAETVIGTNVTVADDLSTEVSQNDGIPGRWTFSGWTVKTPAEGVTITENAEGSKTFTMPGEDVTLTGSWTFTATTYTVTWMSGETEIEKDENVAYNATPSFDQDTNPTKADDEQYSYTFAGWGTSADATETVTTFPVVTENVTYYAIFTAEKTAYQIIFEDYTKGGASVDLEKTAIEGHENCYIGTHYYRNSVTVTVSASLATVVAIHTDNDGMSYSKLMDENGSYERLYCTAVDGGYQFTIPISSGDVYIVMAYKGDVNLDSRTNTVDAGLCAQVAARLLQFTNLRSLIGDIRIDNRNNTVDSGLCAQVAARLLQHVWDTNS